MRKRSGSRWKASSLMEKSWFSKKGIAGRQPSPEKAPAMGVFFKYNWVSSIHYLDVTGFPSSQSVPTRYSGVPENEAG